GTETDGSIVCPASSQSLVGIKPTVGLVSRVGILPIAHSQDTAGAMARTVTDAAVLLAVLAGADQCDPATTAKRRPRGTDYTAALRADGLRGARLGVAREGYFGYSEETDRLIEEAVAEMARLGAVIVDPADVPTAEELGSSPAELDVLLFELKADLNAYLDGRGADVPVRTLAEVIEFNERNAAAVMPWFGQDLFVKAQEKGPLSDSAYRKARAESLRLAGEKGIDAVLREHRLDALVAPTMAPPFKIDLVNGDHFLGGSSQPAAVAGYPAVTVPAGYVSGLPVGLTFMGAAWSEATLIRLAYGFEQATKARRPPMFQATADPDGAPMGLLR
nr:amidase [Gemmatimonadota bacterium]